MPFWLVSNKVDSKVCGISSMFLSLCNKTAKLKEGPQHAKGLTSYTFVVMSLSKQECLIIES